MPLLIIFAFLAGVTTILAPCIIPILPIVLSAGATGGKRRPVGIVVGLVASFTLFTLAISSLTHALGISSSILRTLAIVILLAFGVLLLLPKLLTRFEGWVSRLLPQNAAQKSRTDFWGGIVIGTSLGLVWTPCVGPIMASVIALAATSKVTAGVVLITLAYGAGTSIPLFALMYGGQNLMTKLKKMGRQALYVQRGFGVVMILTAISMLFGLDLSIQSALLAKLPTSISSGLTQQLEEGRSVQNQLNILRGNTTPIPSSGTGTSSDLPIIGIAPQFTGITDWLNSPPLTMTQLRGKVVLVDFWTYSCINCLRTLPHLISWNTAYKDQGLVIVGVSAPEFDFEKSTSNVQQAITRLGITYPVAQDNNLATWNAYNNEYWPGEYLIDAQGRIRATDFGEGEYDTMQANIEMLIKEANKTAVLPKAASVPDLTPEEAQSPETYLGDARQSGYKPGATPSSLRQNEWTLNGSWDIGDQFITSDKAEDSLSYRFIGQNVYMVLNPPAGKTVTIQVDLDGKPISASQAGADVQEGSMIVDSDRLYNLVHLSQPDSGHLLTITVKQAGLEAYTFTFG